MRARAGDDLPVDYLRDQLELGRAALFTGAGFASDVADRDGHAIATARQLTRELWQLCFPEERQDGSTLPDLFHHALKHCPRKLEALLNRRLRVDPRSLLPRHARWFSLPWRRVYTTNVDDLERAVSRRYHLPFVMRTISALTPGRRRLVNGRPPLSVVHLNGVIDDGPRNLTFSPIQYGEPLARRCDFYALLVEELKHLTFLFVGTQLAEIPFWHEIEAARARSAKKRGARSFLVAPRIDHARLSLLAELGIEWIQMTAHAFADRVLPACAPNPIFVS
jgi:hypothetical protein